MPIPDTDHFSDLLRRHDKGVTLRNRLARTDIPFAISIVSAEEHIRGRLARLSRERDLDRLMGEYDKLRVAVEATAAFPIASWSNLAVSHMHRLISLKLGIGAMDLRIASIALANGVKLLSRNMRDFERIPDLDVHDWTA